MSARLPLFLELAGKPVLVAGGGPVALRRVTSLLDAGADVTVVSPALTGPLRELADAGRVDWQARPFDAADLDPVWLAFACTGDADVDAGVVAAADRQRIWSVRASAADASPAWCAATARLDDGVQVAVSGGGDPRRAQQVRDAVVECADRGALPLRRIRPGTGKVFLVGGGPGDPDLMTVRARRLLALADVVVTDRLAPVAALSGLDVEVIDVGKSPRRHAMRQDDINRLLVDRAGAGQLVVRFKGGDPFVLGRGGEEALACVAAGVDVEVVPGVTSAVSVPAAAGIPITHRGLAASALILSGHDGAADVVRRAAATPADTTLVVLMGVRHLADTAAALIAAGRPADLPAAVVAEGWTQRQRSVAGTLGTIADLAREHGLGSPAVIVIGAVAGLHDVLGGLAAVTPASRHGAPAPSAAHPRAVAS